MLTDAQKAGYERDGFVIMDSNHRKAGLSAHARASLPWLRLKVRAIIRHRINRLRLGNFGDSRHLKMTLATPNPAFYSSL